MNRSLKMTCLAALSSAVVFSAAAVSLAAPVRHIICNQLDWNNNLGVVFEIGNDQAKDDAIAPLKTATVSAGLGTGTKWNFLSYSNIKWELNKEYPVKFVVTPAGAELWVDGKRRGVNKSTFQVFDSKPEINGVPDWATGQAAYGVFIKSLKITTNDGNDYEATYDMDSWEPRLKSTFPEDWKLADTDTSFTIDVVMSFLPAE